MHQKRFRKADRLPGYPLHPGSSREMLAFDRLRMLFSDFVMVWGEVTPIHSGLIRIKLCDPKWSSIFFPWSKDLIFMYTTDIGQAHPTGMINGLP